MKRLLVFSVIAGLGMAFAGCGEETKTTKKETTKTPGGTTTKEETKKVETSGKNPPAP